MSHHIRPVEFGVRGLTLRGTCYVPHGAGPFPTAVLHHGFGGQRTEVSRAFVQLARGLASRGIAAVAVDRAGHGESDGDFADTTVSGDVEDSLAVLDRIAACDMVDPSDIHLVGMSIGAVVASVVAAETGLPVRSLTMWSVAAVFVDELRSGRLQGVPTDHVDEDGFFDFHGLRLGPDFFRDACAFDVYGRARGFQGPVRVLHGGCDFVPASYAEAYAEVYGDAMHYTFVPQADHCWETVEVRDLVLDETIRFVAAHAGRSGRNRCRDDR